MRPINRLTAIEWLQRPTDEYGESKVIWKNPMKLKQENVFPYDQNSSVKHVDNEKLVIDQSFINYIEIILWGGGFLFLLYFVIADWEKEIFIKKFLSIIVLLGLFFLLLRTFRDLSRKFIFNRLTGEVTYPATMWFRYTTKPFDETPFFKHTESMRSAIPYGLAIRRAPLNFVTLVIPFKVSFYSFLVWCMDCNRPLPAGSAFDDYRERDYERRKAEGFPEPIYPSGQKTPEWEGATDKDARKRELINYHSNLMRADR